MSRWFGGSRKPNEYVVGEYVFAEWRERDEKSTGEGWTFYLTTNKKDLVDGEGFFHADSRDNAAALVKFFDVILDRDREAGLP